MHQWQPQAYEYLLKKDYASAASLYEQAIADAPEDVINYFYLGLLQLLQGQEADAQFTWMVCINDEADFDQIENWTSQLVEILFTESQRQIANRDYETSWLICQHIHEIDRSNLDNSLTLVWLSIQLQTLDEQSDVLIEVIENLTEIDVSESVAFSRELLWLVQAELARYEPYPRLVEFTQACLTFVQEPKAFVANLSKHALELAYLHQRDELAIALLEICLTLLPEEISVLECLSSIYLRINKHDQALETAKRYFQLSQGLAHNFYPNYLMLRALLSKGGDWQESMSLFATQQALLSNLINENPSTLSPAIIRSLYIVNYFAPYINDQARLNRTQQNQIAALSQANLNYDLSAQMARFQQRISGRARNKSKKLKIAYISRCMATHSIGWLARWLIMHRDRQQFEVYGYFLGYRSYPDPLQEWYTTQMDHVYRAGIDGSDDASVVANKIYQDQIDILIDLDSITSDLGCAVMALKPAPIQVSWLGCDASGLPTIDYFIADPYVLPDSAQEYYAERIWRVPKTYIAVDGFEIGVPTLRRDRLDIPADAVVYLSAQNAFKRHPDTIRLQMQIIKAVPNSYFLIKGLGDQEAIKESFISIAIAEGVAPEKLRFLPMTASEEEHRANLGIADIVLDTYPYNGATTTLETLWMCIPIVTKVGEQFAARNSYTMMVNAGISEGIAWNEAEYIEWGIRLGQDAALRKNIATRLKTGRQTAPLWNAKQFTRDMENAYQQMWQQYVNTLERDSQKRIDSNLKNSDVSAYWQYVQECCPHINLDSLTHLKASIANTNWEEPESSLDFNNIAVMAMIEADNTQDLSERSLYWEFAVQTLKQGVELPNGYLCKANLTGCYSLVDDLQASIINLAHQYFTEIQNAKHFAEETGELGLVYFPRHVRRWVDICRERLPVILGSTNSIIQAHDLLLEVLCYTPICYYNGSGLRFRQLAILFNRDSAILNLEMGMAGFSHQQTEHLAYLHYAAKLTPNSPQVLQALYLAYLNLRQLSIAEQWKAIACEYAQSNSQNNTISRDWAWTNLNIESPFTYAPFGDDLLIAVEPSYLSISTIILIAQKDWFEPEMELWRDRIEVGMTVIDVGANIGVYTYSAAQMVGEKGKVIAIEPFSTCISCLTETRRINRFDWVHIISGAASDRNGTAKLSLNSSSELNEIIPDSTEATSSDQFETVSCITIDSLIDQENLTRIDWLKIDAEGHEINVLRGCKRILAEFKPNIIYENLDGYGKNNIEVSEYLAEHGYHLFHYLPYLKHLVPITSAEEIQGKLNIIAIYDQGESKFSLPQKLSSPKIIEEISSLEITSQADNKPNNNLYKIVMVVSGGLEQFIENTIKSIANCNIDLGNVEIFTPRNVKSDLQNLLRSYSIGKITAIEDITNQEVLENNNNYHNIGTADFGQFTIYKWIIIKNLLNQGTQNVIYTDVDIAWRQNPIELLQKINNNYDLAIQTEGEAYFPPHFCTGFMSFANTVFSHQLLDSLIELQIEVSEIDPTFHDQFVFNTLVDRNVDLVNNIFPLSEILFANGLTAKLMCTSDSALEKIQIVQPQPMIFHANCTVGLENKKKMLQKTGNWLL
jgi:FkbM family methyltransferase